MAGVAGYVAVNSLGLGHAARAIAIAREMQRRHPGLELFFLAGSPALDLAVSHGFDAMPLPPTPEWFHENGRIHSMGRWYREYVKYLRYATRFLRKEADWDRFRFLISDGEMASVRLAVRRHIPTVAIVHSIGQDFGGSFLARRIESFGRWWMRSLLTAKTVRVLALERGIDLPNATYVGPIVRPPAKSREELRDDFVFLKKTILVAPGGTSLGKFLIDEAIRAFRELHLSDTQMIVVTGPKIPAPKEAGVFWRGFVPNLQDYVTAADLVITMAGKGTMYEALAAGTPVIAIPAKGHAEAERNLRAANLPYSFEDAYRLRELIPTKLAEPRSPPTDFGPARAVAVIEEFLAAQGVALGDPPPAALSPRPQSQGT
ncbi:MAG TPA: glycosyltransferase [Thermoplasmata archaeon]|jgi:UDP:flavonoid glycosyltransferase YjiC (YdhE family)|nr:glycosyltransferase [Thermoplasmata archaeon]